MNREVQAVVVVLVGSALLKLSLTDIHLRYVRPAMAPYLLAAGAAMVLLGLWTVLVEGVLRRPGPPVPASGGHSEGGGDHDHAGDAPRAAWLLLLPVLAVFLVAPPALGAYAATHNAGRRPPARTSEFGPLPAGDPVVEPLTDYVTRAAWDGGATLRGRRVSLLGFVTPGKDGVWYLSRMVISCCAADSYPVSVQVLGQSAPPADTWIRVTGSFAPSPRSAELAALQADSLEVVQAPRDPYET